MPSGARVPSLRYWADQKKEEKWAPLACQQTPPNTANGC